MRFLFVSDMDWVPSAAENKGIKQGVEALGHEFLYVDPLLNDPSPEDTAAKIMEARPDIVVYGTTTSLTKKIPLLVNNTVQVFWMQDYKTPKELDMYQWFGWIPVLEKMSAIFLSPGCQTTMWKKFTGVPSFFLPMACWIPPKDLVYDKDFDHDLLFIGSFVYTGPLSVRTRLIDKIKEEVTITHVNADSREGRDVIYANMSKFYYSSKASLDISHYWDCYGYCSSRYWHSATFGGCSVTKRFPGCERLIPEGHKFYFDTPEEAVEKIKEIQATPVGYRNAVRWKVSRWAWRNHNYYIRISQMFDYMDGKEVKI